MRKALLALTILSVSVFSSSAAFASDPGSEVRGPKAAIDVLLLDSAQGAPSTDRKWANGCYEGHWFMLYINDGVVTGGFTGGTCESENFIHWF